MSITFTTTEPWILSVSVVTYQSDKETATILKEAWYKQLVFRPVHFGDLCELEAIHKQI